MTSKSESVGFSWDPTDLRANLQVIFEVPAWVGPRRLSPSRTAAQTCSSRSLESFWSDELKSLRPRTSLRTQGCVGNLLPAAVDRKGVSRAQPSIRYPHIVDGIAFYDSINEPREIEPAQGG